MKRLLTICIALLLSYTGFSQVPGYMGKKLSFQVDVLTFPAVFHPTNARGKIKNGFNFYGFNWRLRGSLDYVFANKVSVGLEASYFRTAGKAYPNKYYLIEGFTIGVNFKFFTRNFLAPHGFYFKVGLHGVYMKGSDINNVLPVNTAKLGGVLLDGGIGKRHIFFDRMTFSYGIEAGLLITDDFLSYFVDNEISSVSEMKDGMDKRMGNHFGVNIYAGVGVLLF